MINPLPEPPLLVITDRATAAGPVEDIVAAALRGGCRWVMWRDKDSGRAIRERSARQASALCRAAGAALTVNGDIDLARTLGAQGVHLQAAHDVAQARGALGAHALIGVSCHSAAEVAAADAAGADYATLSPIFLTDSKPGYGPAIGLEALRTVCAAAKLPVVALAGIDEGTAGLCRAAGAHAVAVMGGVMGAADPEAVVAALIHAMEHPSRGRESC